MDFERKSYADLSIRYYPQNKKWGLSVRIADPAGRPDYLQIAPLTTEQLERFCWATGYKPDDSDITALRQNKNQAKIAELEAEIERLRAMDAN